ncbi:MAG: MBL fold metallo-hydrolase [Acidobacteriota bacterium]
MPIRYILDDVVKIYAFGKKRTKDNLIASLFWGDKIEVSADETKAILPSFQWNEAKKKYDVIKREGAIPEKARLGESPGVLKVRFLDVGQGDAAMIETPKGRFILLDGGEERHLRRYVAAAFAHLFKTGPLDVAAIVVSHGDADHFAGLTKLVQGRREGNEPMVCANRVFHNGLVKGTKTTANEAFGATKKVDGVAYATELEDDLRTVPEARMNAPFKAWAAALKALRTIDGKKPKMERLEYGDGGKFEFLDDEHIKVEVLGPSVEEIGGKPALRLLHTPGTRSLSASHTINGHSVVLRLVYGNVRFLFGADLNEESEERLLERARAEGVSLASEVLKVPHHGSADFSPATLEAIRAVVSVVSSGDESETKEYIHPRAGLVGALGKYSRPSVTKPLIYVTEMVAFFKRIGPAMVTPLEGRSKTASRFSNVYNKSVFGIVHVRTDGSRVLVATPSGKADQKEAYAFTVSASGEIAFGDVNLA